MSRTQWENVVVVAVRAEREISKVALAWALTNIVHPGDVVTLLAVLSDHDREGRWSRWLQRGFRFTKFSASKDAGGGVDPRRRGRQERCQISASCSEMALQIDGKNEVKVRIKVLGSEVEDSSISSTTSSVAGGRGGVVAAESKLVGANWIVLDKQLKHEVKQCLEELQCNIVVMKGSCARVLRLSLDKLRTHPTSPSSCTEKKLPDDVHHPKPSISCTYKANASNKLTSLPLVTTNNGGSFFESLLVHKRNPLFVQGYSPNEVKQSSIGVPKEGDEDAVVGSPESKCGSTSSRLGLFHQDGGYIYPAGFRQEPAVRAYQPSTTFPNEDGDDDDHVPSWSPRSHNWEATRPSIRTYETRRNTSTYTSEVREAVSLLGSSPSNPPPLCSTCRHKPPLFGRPPRRFTYRELEEATGGFSEKNLVGRGRHGRVHRGVLGDGQAVAVKETIKDARKDNDDDHDHGDGFLSEVESISRAQHRNVVMLIGFCAEGKKRVLVYEFICNGSLDLHLHCGGRELEWRARVKVAVGAARGLRYLHEDCRVGFLVHGNIRPSNILLTHDFEPMVGDFSLRKHRFGRSTQVDIHFAKKFGYLAPEYMEYGLLSEKADVYAFGVLLLELLTGRRSMDTTQPKGQQLLTDWAQPHLVSLASDREGRMVAGLNRFMDPSPRLDRDQARYFSGQLRAMSCAASMCLLRDPQARPTMSKVLRILEGGDALLEQRHLQMSYVGSRSGRVSNLIHRRHDDDDDNEEEEDYDEEEEGVGGGSTSLRFPREAASIHDFCVGESYSTFY